MGCIELLVAKTAEFIECCFWMALQVQITKLNLNHGRSDSLLFSSLPFWKYDNSKAIKGFPQLQTQDLGFPPRLKKPVTVPYCKLFSFADSTDIALMVLGSIGAVGYGVTMPLMAIVMGEMVDSFGKQTTQNKEAVVGVVSKVAIDYIYLGLGAAVASFLEMCCWMVAGERQAARIRSLYLQTILRQDIAFFDNETSTGEIITRMSNDTFLIQEAMGEKVGKFLQLAATFVGGLVIAFIRGWRLALVMLSAIPFMVLSGGIMAKVITKVSANGHQSYSDAGILVEQIISSIRTVASFTGEKRATTAYDKFLDKTYKSSVRQGIAAGIGMALVMMVIFSTYALAVWYGGKLILNKGYTGGQVLNVLLAILTASLSLGQAASCITAFAAGKSAAYKMFETINRRSEIDAYDSRGRMLDDLRGDIELRDLYFSYPTRPEEQILSGFSLMIPSGTSTAIVGHSGSGKSTLISLIERFYDPQSGEVLIDGINLKELQLKWIRQKIGLVSQEPVLFASSIRDNIVYGKDGASDEEIKSAVELANASKFINRLPQGLDTMAGECGTQLSGGQKQRISIARAILKDPRILLLDEATSALDTKSERIVQEALDRIMINRTSVIVAHRLTTVRNVDAIAIIHQGKIVEKGSHTELLKDPDGPYSHLMRFQEEAHDLSRASSRLSSVSSRSLSFGTPDAPNSKVGAQNPAKENIPEVPLRRLAYLNKPEIPVLLAGTIAACAQGTILPIYGVLISRAIQSFFESADKLRSDTKFWSLIFLGLGLATLVVHPLKSYLFAVAGSRLIHRIRSMCFQKVVNMEIGWFDEPEHSSGAIGARLSADAAIVRNIVGDALAQMVQNVATVVAALVIAFTASWQLALIMLALIPLIGMNKLIQVRFMKGFSADAKGSYEEASQIASNALGSIRTVASFCGEEKVMKLYNEKCEIPMKNGVWLGLISGIGFGISSLCQYLFYATSFYSGARLVARGLISFTDVFQVFFSLSMAVTGLAHSGSNEADSSKAKAAATSVFSIIDRKSQIDSSVESGITLDNLKGEIELRHVSFKYPSRPNVQVLRDINLTIRSGESVALVGESGSGKSTVIALLQRFYDPDSGHITLDNIEINKLQLKWLRRQSGLVSQEPHLFNDTIRANIAYGKEGDPSEAEIISASELANAHHFISGLQLGYDTMVGDRGIQLSGGQKQRVAIARAIIKCPKILLLDEATSALDAESERVVQDALCRVMVNRTTIILAHRLSTIRNADLIAVVKNGMIVEKGNHETLVNMKYGVYASLVAHQTSAKT
ncbi:ABC transporter B family member 11 [Linum perenne]